MAIVQNGYDLFDNVFSCDFGCGKNVLRVVACLQAWNHNSVERVRP